VRIYISVLQPMSKLKTFNLKLNISGGVLIFNESI